MRGSPRMGFPHEKRRWWAPLSAFRLSSARGVQALPAQRRAGQARHLRWVPAAFAFPWMRGSPRMRLSPYEKGRWWRPLYAFRLSSAWGVQVLSAERRAGQARHLRVGSCSLRASVDAGLAPHGPSPYGKRRPSGRLFPFSIPCGNQAASACSRRGPSASARPTMSTSRSSSASSMPKCGVKRSEFSPPWITLTPCMRSHSSVELAP